jgi:hypothetical protein
MNTVSRLIESARGSSSLPKSVTSPRLRARWPSKPSVSSDITTITRAATRAQRPSCMKASTKIGLRKMRAAVSWLARVMAVSAI